MSSPPPAAAASSGNVAPPPSNVSERHLGEAAPAPLPAAETPASTTTPTSSPAASSAKQPVDVEAAPASPSRRALTYEEFRQFYVASKKSDFARHGAIPESVHHPHELEELRAEEDAAERERRRRLAAELCTDLTAMAQRRHAEGRARVHGLGDLNRPGEGAAAAAAAGSGGGVMHQAPVLPAQPEEAGPVSRLFGALFGAVGWLIQQAADNIVQVVQFSLMGYIIYSQADGDGSLLLMAMGAFAVFTALRAVVRNFRIGHETGTVSAPSLLGRLFKPEGQTGPVSAGRRVGYIVAKCAEAFLLSLFPTYSIERLETELTADGIVR